MKTKLILIMVAVMVCVVFTGCDRTGPEIKGVKSKIEVQCGTDFNLNQYLNENLKISDVTDEGTKEYKLSDLEYTIKCDETVYDMETGKVDTDYFGTYEVELTVKDEARNKTTKNYTLELNALLIEKGFYMYQDEFDEEFSLLGFCSFENTSKDFIKITSIEFNYFDAEGVVLGTCDDPDLSPEFLDKGDIGYAIDCFTGWDMMLTNKADVAEVKVKINYQIADKDVDNALEVGEMSIIRSYGSNVSGFAAEGVITNPYDKSIEQYQLIVGLYDKDGKLIGVMDAIDTGNILADGKARVIASWLPDPTTIPDQTVSVKGAAHVISFEEK